MQAPEGTCLWRRRREEVALEDSSTRAFRDTHVSLSRGVGCLSALAGKLRNRSGEVSTSELQQVFEWLVSEVLSQTAKEEQHVYPIVDQLIAEHGKATETMVMDHVEIREKVTWFGEAVASLVSSGGGDGAEDLRDRIRVLAYQLEVLISLHVRKDQQVYLGILEQYARLEVVDQLSDGDYRAGKEDGNQ